MTAYTAIRKALPRLEAVAKVTGESRYAGDVKVSGLLHAKILRSPVAHARITRLDVSRARLAHGVFGVYTHLDLRDGLRIDPAERVFHLLADDEICYYGQPIAVALAEDPSVAEEALDLVELELEELPVVVDALQALEPDALPVRTTIRLDVDRSEEAAHTSLDTSSAAKAEGSVNVTQRVAYSRGDVAAGFARAAVVVERRWVISRVHQGYLEPQTVLVDYQPGVGFTVWVSTQGTFRVREELTQLLKVPEGAINVQAVESGGGFGGKTRHFAAALAAGLAFKARRPVKLVMSRSEDLRAANPAPGAVIDLKIGATREGRLTALSARVIFDVGAYPGGPTMGAANHVGSMYTCPNLAIEGLEVLTNKVSVGAMRAPGGPQVTFALESHMDLLSRQLGMDPLELRLLNAVDEGDLQANGRPYPTIGLKACLKTLQESDFWKARTSKGPNEGIGIAMGGWHGGVGGPAAAVASLNGDGTVNVVVGSQDITGVNTSFQQIAAEILGLPPEAIFVRQGDTASAPYSALSAGSRTLMSSGRAVRVAAEDVRSQLQVLAARQLECSAEDLEAVEGAIRVKGSPDRSISIAKLAAMTTAQRGREAYIVGRGQVGAGGASGGFSVQAMRVHVEPDTGLVTLREALCIQDVGLAINTLSVEGQMQGGVAQAVAIGLTEEMVYDERGILRNPTLLDYRMPTAEDLPRIDAVFVEVPTNEQELWGAKGIGEPPILAGAPALANAVADATGVRVNTAPVTAERILQAWGKLERWQ